MGCGESKPEKPVEKEEKVTAVDAAGDREMKKKKKKSGSGVSSPQRQHSHRSKKSSPTNKDEGAADDAGNKGGKKKKEKTETADGISELTSSTAAAEYMKKPLSERLAAFVPRPALNYFESEEGRKKAAAAMALNQSKKDAADEEEEPFEPFSVNFENATIVMADVSGFTKLSTKMNSEKDGLEKMSLFLNAYFHLMIGCFEKYGGEVINFAGDAVVLLFRGDQSAKRALNGALRCMTDAKSTTPIPGVKLTCHIACAFGTLTGMFLGGFRGKMEFVVAGAPLRDLKRALEASRSGEIVCSRHTWTAAGGDAAFECDEVESKDGDEADDPDRELFLVRSALLADALSPQNECPIRPLHELSMLQKPESLPLLRSLVDQRTLQLVEANREPKWLASVETVAVAFMNIHGLRMSMQEPTLVLAQAVLERLQEIVFQLDGWVRQFIVDDKGTVLIAAFTGTEDFAFRAIKCALICVEALNQIGVRHQIGVASGPAFIGPAGDPVTGSRSEISILGVPVNLAARLSSLQSHGGGVLLCPTVSRDSARFETVVRGKVGLKGFDQPLTVRTATAFKVMGAIRRTDQQRYVGRDSVVKSVMGWLDGFRKKKMQGSVLIEGERGIGKSALVDTAVRLTVEETKIQVVWGAGDSTERHSPLFPFRSLFGQLLGLNEMDSKVERRFALQQLVQTVIDADDRVYAPLLNSVLFCDLPTNATCSALKGKERAQKTRDLLTALAQNTGRRVPTLIVLEDFHFFDVQSRELVKQLCDSGRVQGRPVGGAAEGDSGGGGQKEKEKEESKSKKSAASLFMMITSRPPDADDETGVSDDWKQLLGSQAPCHSVRLDPLDEQASYSLLSHRLSVDELPAQLKPVALQASGSPLKLTQVAAVILANDSLSEEIPAAAQQDQSQDQSASAAADGRQTSDSGGSGSGGSGQRRLKSGVDCGPILDQLQGTLDEMARNQLKLLRPQELDLLKTASVFGDLFDIRHLVALHNTVQFEGLVKTKLVIDDPSMSTSGRFAARFKRRKKMAAGDAPGAGGESTVTAAAAAAGGGGGGGAGDQTAQSEFAALQLISRLQGLGVLNIVDANQVKFVHSAIRVAANELMTRQQRVVLHLQAARLFERQSKSHLVKLSEQALQQLQRQLPMPILPTSLGMHQHTDDAQPLDGGDQVAELISQIAYHYHEAVCGGGADQPLATEITPRDLAAACVYCDQLYQYQLMAGSADSANTVDQALQIAERLPDDQVGGESKARRLYDLTLLKMASIFTFGSAQDPRLMQLSMRVTELSEQCSLSLRDRAPQLFMTWAILCGASRYDESCRSGYVLHKLTEQEQDPYFEMVGNSGMVICKQSIGRPDLCIQYGDKSLQHWLTNVDKYQADWFRFGGSQGSLLLVLPTAARYVMGRQLEAQQRLCDLAQSVLGAPPAPSHIFAWNSMPHIDFVIGDACGGLSRLVLLLEQGRVPPPMAEMYQPLIKQLDLLKKWSPQQSAAQRPAGTPVDQLSADDDDDPDQAAADQLCKYVAGLCSGPVPPAYKTLVLLISAPCAMLSRETSRQWAELCTKLIDDPDNPFTVVSYLPLLLCWKALALHDNADVDGARVCLKRATDLALPRNLVAQCVFLVHFWAHFLRPALADVLDELVQLLRDALQKDVGGPIEFGPFTGRLFKETCDCLSLDDSFPQPKSVCLNEQDWPKLPDLK